MRRRRRLPATHDGGDDTLVEEGEAELQVQLGVRDGRKGQAGFVDIVEVRAEMGDVAEGHFGNCPLLGTV